jgi:hypothetical protein
MIVMMVLMTTATMMMMMMVGVLASRVIHAVGEDQMMIRMPMKMSMMIIMIECAQ